ncbi:MAG: response regulator [Candidatus Eisenbacteria bacterium]
MPKGKILIVDDDLDLQRGLGIRLCAEGYEVVAAADAVSATSVARRERPDVIILDLGLPGGDGYAVMDRLKLLLVGSIPVIVLTARDPATDKARAKAEGAVAYFQKPVEHRALLRAIERALTGVGSLKA